jgi:hypothetical protein
MTEEFKFPDEEENKVDAEIDIDVSSETDIDIEVEDDTPERDRNAKPLNREVEDPTDEEIEGYTKGVQGRIKELTHARHDERRAKEAALREKQELERLTQQILEENRKLKEYVKSGEATYKETLQAKTEAEMEMARRKYKEAAESYDTDAMMAAQEALTEAKMKMEEAKNFRPTPLQNREVDVQMQQEQPEAPRLDEKTLRWQAKNQWFGTPGYEEVTAFALGLHQKLVSTGYNPQQTEYFEQIDSRLKRTFPEMFVSEEDEDRGQKAAPTKKPATVVAPSSRTTGAKKTVKITASQAATADRLGIPRDLYVKEFLKLEANNG